MYLNPIGYETNQHPKIYLLHYTVTHENLFSYNYSTASVIKVTETNNQETIFTSA